MKYIVYILLFFPIWVTAQTYKYIGIEKGLSNRRIFNIQKDAQGYMWFLTNEGMDRYNGKDIKHYKLNKEGTTLDAPVRLGWLYTGSQIGIWVIGKQGRIFQYEANGDDFRMVYKQQPPLKQSAMAIWIKVIISGYVVRILYHYIILKMLTYFNSPICCIVILQQ